MLEKEAKEQPFKDGAELGYYQVNDWHNQNMDDICDSISKDWSIKHFICVMNDKSLNTAVGNCDEGCNGEVSVNLVFDHDDEKYYIDDIAYWKEVTLPEETKNERLL